MNITSKFVFFATFALIASTNLLGMGTKNKLQKTEAIETTESAGTARLKKLLLVSDKKILYDIVYATLNPLPKELINLILEYLYFEFQGKINKEIHIPIEAKGLSDYFPLFLVPLSSNKLAVGYHFSILIVDVQTGSVIKKINIPNSLKALTALTSEMLVSGHNQGELHVWDSKQTTDKPYQTMHTSYSDILQLAALSNSRFAAASDDSKINVYNADTQKPINRFECPGCLKLVYIPEKNWLAASTKNDGIKFWDLLTDKPEKAIDHNDAAYLLLLPNNILVTATKLKENNRIKETGESWKIIIWNVATQQRLRKFNLSFPFEASLIDFTLIHGNQLLGWLNDGRNYCFNLLDGKLKKKFKLHDKQTACCSIPFGWDQMAQIVSKERHDTIVFTS